MNVLIENESEEYFLERQVDLYKLTYKTYISTYILKSPNKSPIQGNKYACRTQGPLNGI